MEAVDVGAPPLPRGLGQGLAQVLEVHTSHPVLSELLREHVNALQDRSVSGRLAPLLPIPRHDLRGRTQIPMSPVRVVSRIFNSRHIGHGLHHDLHVAAPDRHRLSEHAVDLVGQIVLHRPDPLQGQ